MSVCPVDRNCWRALGPGLWPCQHRKFHHIGRPHQYRWKVTVGRNDEATCRLHLGKTEREAENCQPAAAEAPLSCDYEYVVKTFWGFHHILCGCQQNVDSCIVVNKFI